MRVLELYAGVGGVAHALEPARGTGRVRMVGAVDQSPLARAAYRSAHGPPRSGTDPRPGTDPAEDRETGGLAPPLDRRVEDLSIEALEAFEADLWWASPPCQPFTKRGLQRDLDDPRAQTFRALLDRVATLRPRWFALENVTGFEGSRAHTALRDTLQHAGYRHLVEERLCPSHLGAPTRRPRFYLLASRDRAPLGRASFSTRAPCAMRRTVAACLDPDADDDARLRLDPVQVERYRFALDIVDRDDPEAVTACFTAAYGRSMVRSGSYLRSRNGGLRRASPREVTRFLGYPRDVAWATEMAPAKAWQLAGNGLSIDAVRHWLAQVPELAAAGEAASRHDRASVDPAAELSAERAPSVHCGP